MLMKESIIPFFKKRGFKRKGNHFVIRVNDVFQVFNVQKSQWNSYSQSLSFTFNLGFYSDVLYLDSFDIKHTTSFPNVYDCQIHFRLGGISHNRDHWYEITQNNLYEETRRDVETDLNKFVVEIFDKYQTLNSLVSLVDDYSWLNKIIGPFSMISLLWHTGRQEDAKKEIQILYQNVLRPRSSSSTINYPDGRTIVKRSEPSINLSVVERVEIFAKQYNITLIKEV